MARSDSIFFAESWYQEDFYKQLKISAIFLTLKHASQLVNSNDLKFLDYNSFFSFLYLATGWQGPLSQGFIANIPYNRFSY